MEIEAIDPTAVRIQQLCAIGLATECDYDDLMGDSDSDSDSGSNSDSDRPIDTVPFDVDEYLAGELHGYYEDDTGSDLDPDDPSYVGFDLDLDLDSYIGNLSDASYDDALYYENIDEEEEDYHDDDEFLPWWGDYDSLEMLGDKLACEVRRHFVYGFQKTLVKPPMLELQEIPVSPGAFAVAYPHVSPGAFVRAVWLLRVRFDENLIVDGSYYDRYYDRYNERQVAKRFGISLRAARATVHASMMTMESLLAIAAEINV